MILMEANKYDKNGKCLKSGKIAEMLFQKVAINNGCTLSDAIKEQDINEHWDKIIIKNNKRSRVDVKARKKINRSDASAQDEWIWIELHGVRKYDGGWIFNGKSEYIAFEMLKSFLIVPRLKIIDIINKHVKKEYVENPHEAKYKIYRRREYDEMTLIHNSLLREVAAGEWLKNKEPIEQVEMDEIL